MKDSGSLVPLVVPDVAAWRAWLLLHEDTADGTWLTLAKRGTTSPTSLSCQEALDEALCSGWIDGQRRALDAHTFVQRFTPRRSRSVWSQRNVGLVDELVAAGRMRPRGQAEIDRAREDGRWERAYAGAATAEIPAELSAALTANGAAREAFAALNRSERYTLLHPILTAPSSSVREQRVERLVSRLAARDAAD